MLFQLILISTFSFNIITCAKILAIVPSPSYSHQVSFKPIWKELSKKGHQITLITTDPMNDESLNKFEEISIRETYEVLNRHNFTSLLNEYKTNPFKVWAKLSAAFHEVTITILENQRVDKLIKSDAKFDLLIVECINLIVLPFTFKFKAPTICVMSLEPHYLLHEIMGNPTHPVAYPHPDFGFIGKLTFLERVFTTLVSLYSRYYMNYMITEVDVLTKKYFGNGYPSAYEQINKIDMMFINGNHVLGQVRPTVPGVIYISGLHLQERKPLPNDLQNFMDSSKNGVIYFSLGTNVKSEHIGNETLINIIDSFNELPYDVLWKYEGDKLPEKPKNIKLIKWAPQQDVLRHKKVKLFITQGGIQSLEETLHSHVPIVGIPFFGDQFANVKRIVNKGCGLLIDYKNLNKDEFKKIIVEVIENEKYKNEIKKMSKLALDEPMTGLEKAIWWTEYVLRHKGAQHLKGPSASLPWYQYLLLDVLCFCIAVVLTFIYVTYLLVQITFGFIKKYMRKIKTD